jgi:hypothetical protein
MRAEVERAIHGALDPAARPDPTDAGIAEASVRAAARYALDVTRHVLDRDSHTAIRAFRFARAAQTA